MCLLLRYIISINLKSFFIHLVSNTSSSYQFIFWKTGPIIPSRSHYTKPKRSCFKVRTRQLSPMLLKRNSEASTSTQRDISNEISYIPNIDNMTKLQPREVGCPTNPNGAHKLLVFHLLELGFWLFRVFHVVQ